MRGRSLLLALLSAFALGGLTLFVVPGTAHAAPSSPRAAVVPHAAKPTPELARTEGDSQQTMLQDANFLYVLVGGSVTKIEKSSMRPIGSYSVR